MCARASVCDSNADFNLIKILHIGDHSSPHLYKWVQPLATEGIVSVIPTRRLHENSKITKFRYAAYILESFFLALEERPQFLHLHYLGSYSPVALLLMFILRKPLAVTLWGSDINFPTNGISRWIKKLALSSADVVFCDAEHIEIKARKVAPSANVVRMEFGLHLDRFNEIFAGRRKKWGEQVCCEDKRLLRFYSNRRHEKLYNVDQVVDIASKLHARVGAKVEIAGSGDHSSLLMEYAKSKGLSPHIFTGAFDEDDLLQQLARHDYYMSASSSDAGLSTSIAEAMCAGLICCLPDILDNSRIVKHKINGLLFDPADPASIIDEILSIYRDEVAHRTMSENANTTINELLNIKECVKVISREIRQCLMS